MVHTVFVRKTGLMAVLFFGVLQLSAHATLIRMEVASGSAVIVDDVNNLQWADVSRFTGRSFSDVAVEIADLNSAVFAGASDWHLASSGEMQGLFDQMVTVGDARQFNPTFPVSIIPGTYSVDIIGRYDHVGVANTHAGGDVRYLSTSADNSTSFQRKNLSGLNYRDADVNSVVGAFVVATRSMQQVPEPGVLSLLVAGLIGLLGIRKRKEV